MTDRLAQNIKRFRLMRGLDQEQLAHLLEISRVTYSKLETGKIQPGDDLFYRLARVFEVDPVMLLQNCEPHSQPLFRRRKLKTQQERACSTQMLLDAERKFSDYAFLEESAGESVPINKELLALVPKPEDSTAARKLGAKVRTFFFKQGFSSVERFGEALEANGVKYLAFAFPSVGEFGFTLHLEDGSFAIALNTHAGISGERQLFTLCHELGHVLMHFQNGAGSEPSAEDAKKQEAEADAFASGLLMPDDEFDMAWASCEGELWFTRVLNVKRKFTVSYQTVIHRLEDKYKEDHPGKAAPPYRVWFYQNYQRRFGRSLSTHEEACPSSIKVESSRFTRLARKSFMDGEITMSRLSEILGQNLMTTREVVNDWMREA